MIYQNVDRNTVAETIGIGVSAVFGKYTEPIKTTGLPGILEMMINRTPYGSKQQLGVYGNVSEKPNFIDVSYSGRYLVRISKRTVPDNPVSVDFSNLPHIEIIVKIPDFEEDASELARFLRETLPELGEENISVTRGFLPASIKDIAEKYAKKKD